MIDYNFLIALVFCAGIVWWCGWMAYHWRDYWLAIGTFGAIALISILGLYLRYC